jgi:hypothetical protein
MTRLYRRMNRSTAKQKYDKVEPEHGDSRRHKRRSACSCRAWRLAAAISENTAQESPCLIAVMAVVNGLPPIAVFGLNKTLVGGTCRLPFLFSTSCVVDFTAQILNLGNAWSDYTS